VLKIATQKFIGLTRSDKNNEMYWKFRDFYEGGVSTPESAPVPQNPKPTDPKVDLPVAETPTVQVEAETKFSSEKELGDSEAVKKFREKYGTASSPKAEQ
jgi:hypothetical protein